jgi:hydroxymethylbilane synthase
VDTRLKKMAALKLDALILAAAGLNRLGLSHLYQGCLPEGQMLPAVGQGALGLEVRVKDLRMRELVACLDDPPSRVAVTAERGFLARLQGGCMVPVAALGQVTGDSLMVTALISDLQGQRLLKDSLTGSGEEAESLGRRLAERLLAQGGREILAEICGLNL